MNTSLEVHRTFEVILRRERILEPGRGGHEPKEMLTGRTRAGLERIHVLLRHLLNAVTFLCRLFLIKTRSTPRLP